MAGLSCLLPVCVCSLIDLYTDHDVPLPCILLSASFLLTCICLSCSPGCPTSLCSVVPGIGSAPPIHPHPPTPPSTGWKMDGCFSLLYSVAMLLLHCSAVCFLAAHTPSPLSVSPPTSLHGSLSYPEAPARYQMFHFLLHLL